LQILLSPRFKAFEKKEENKNANEIQSISIRGDIASFLLPSIKFIGLISFSPRRADENLSEIIIVIPREKERERDANYTQNIQSCVKGNTKKKAN
jgi:hypothetical protein